MKNLLAWITASTPFVIPTRSQRGPGRDDPYVNISRSNACWDEALMAAMYDENARTFLDLMGPRGR
jgi:hypothetical protein